jgi:hypothetical protein
VAKYYFEIPTAAFQMMLFKKSKLLTKKCTMGFSLAELAPFRAAVHKVHKDFIINILFLYPLCILSIISG